MRSIAAILAIGTMLFLCAVPFGWELNGASIPIDADGTDNDWPEEAARIGTGSYQGEVSDYYEGKYPNWTEVEDDDYYSILVPPYLSLNVRIDSIKGYDPELSCQSVYHDNYARSHSSSIELYVYYDGIQTDSWDNVLPEELEQVIRFSGNCSYVFTIWFEKVELKYMQDQQFNWVDKDPITNGTFAGSVDAEDTSEPSAEYYIMTVLNGSAGRVTLQKVGSEMDFLKMEVYERYDFSGDVGISDYFEDDVDVFLTDEQRSLVYDPYEEAAEDAGHDSSPFSSWYDDDDGLDPGFYPGDMDIFIRVWGTGNYTITFEQIESEYLKEMLEDIDEGDEEDDDGEEGSSTDDFDFFSISLFCTIVLPFMLLMWIVVVLVIVNLVKRKRSKEPDIPPSQRQGREGPSGVKDPEEAKKGT